MNFQGGAFWSSFGVRFDMSTFPIDKLLAKDDCTLEQLLDEDELIQECKYDNATLVNFLCQPDVIKKMVDYLILKPEDDESKEKQRYPYIVSELFNSEVPGLVDALFEDKELLPKLFSILDDPPPLQPERVAYFRKVIFVLVQMKYDQLLQWMKSQKNVVHKMIEHIGLYSLMELLIMVGWDDAFGQVNDTQWMYKEGVIPKLLSKLAPEYENEPDVHANAARALILIVQKAPSDKHNLLISHLQSDAMMERLFSHMFSKSESSLLHCLSIVTMLVQRASMNQREFMDIDQENDEEWGVETPFLICLKYMEKLHDILRSDRQLTYYSPIGATKVLGTVRMEAVRLFSLLFQCQTKEVVDELIRLDVLSTLLDLFFEFEWNNNLHGFVESVVLYILESGNSDLVVLLFEKGKIIDRLINGFNNGVEQENYDPSTNPPRQRKFRSGYMGHLIRISNNVASCREPEVLQYTEIDDVWKQFIEDHIKDENNRQSILLGGVRPTLASEDDELDDDLMGQQYSSDYKDNNWQGQLDMNSMALPDFMANLTPDFDDDDDLDHDWPENIQGDDDDSSSSEDDDDDDDDDEDGGNGFMVYTPNEYEEYSDSSSSEEDINPPLPQVPSTSPTQEIDEDDNNNDDAENNTIEEVTNKSKEADDGKKDNEKTTTGLKNEDEANTNSNQNENAQEEEDDDDFGDIDVSKIDAVGFSLKDRVRRGSEFNDVQFWRPSLHISLDDLEEL